MRSTLIFLFFAVPFTAQSNAPHNLKVLRTSSTEEVNQVMRTFTLGLGVQCEYCHVQRDFASDANAKKQDARRMIRLLQKVNAEFPDGSMRVSCYTCHRGEAQPRTAPEPH